MIIFQRIWKQITKMDFGFIFLLSLIIVLIGTFGSHFLEPETFPSLFDGFWWTMTTLTTVGYGDYFPVSVGGRMLGIFLFIFGIGIIGVLISKTVDSITTFQKFKREGKLVYTYEDHYIYINWSKKTERAIEEILAHVPDAEIVLIDMLPITPIEHEQVHFIQGDPSDENVLLKANIFEAKRVAIFSDSKIEDPSLVDGKTLLIASAVEGLSKTHQREVHTIVEVSEDRHIPKFQHIAVEDFILSNDSVSLLMAKATLHPGTTTLFRQLLSKRYGNNIHEFSVKDTWKTVKQASEELLEKGAILLAVNDNMDFSNAMNQELHPEDTLYVVCHDRVYEQLTQ
ncbi:MULTISPECIES: TrkA family potassium uptake protein [Rossellomorea]|uniref:potassium channel family protein n=1 Tax=Rossellomorea TaxID=2837508 RepID=UPI00077C8EC2|nr:MULTISPECIES: potassium channel protein [Rossellomorea]UTE77725.1 ion channel [Rossellomorea sp. KS-H15a]WQI94429.1 ion channel [Rossellomorea vietnamensis]